MPPELPEAIDRRATELFMNRSEYIRGLLLADLRKLAEEGLID